MNLQQNLRVVLYARFSSDNQRSESIDAQIRAMKKYCRDHKHKIINIYTDEARSATTDKRPSFQKMITDCKLHNFDAVIVHKLDRFSRNRYDSAMYKRELRKNGVKLYSVLENLDDSPESVMMEAMLEGMSEYYSKNLGREVMKGLTENAMQCKHTGGLPPLGFKLDSDKHLIIDDEKAPIIKTIFEMYNDDYGYTKIIEYLNKIGFTTQRGNHFGKNSLHDILINEKYVGVYVYNRSSSKNFRGKRNHHLSKPDDEIIRISGGCPKIIDDELFENVQKKMEIKKHSGGRFNSKMLYMLSGLITCSECGKLFNGNNRYSGRNKRQHSTYRCTTHRDICTNKEINKMYIEAYVIELLKRNFLNKNALTKHIQKANSYIDKLDSNINTETAKLKKQLKSIKDSIANITAAIEKGIPADTFLSRLTELDEQKISIECELLKLNNSNTTKIHMEDIDSMINIYRKALSDLTSPVIKDFIQDKVKRIAIDDNGAEITLNTGFGISDKLNVTVKVTRDDIYDFGRRNKDKYKELYTRKDDQDD